MKSKRNDILRTLMILGIILLGSFVLSSFFFKIDLTAEKRHSLTPATVDMLEKLDDKMFVRCYLHGDFPAGYKHLEQAIRERLDEFRDYSDGRIEYEFIDPYESGNKKLIGETEKALVEKGLQFTNLSIDENGAQGNKLIWPGAIIQYNNKEYPVQFLSSNTPVPDNILISNSINNLEFELASNIRKITRSKKPAIAILQGHQETDKIHMADFFFGLQENYDVEFMQIDSQVNAFSDKLEGMSKRVNRYDALIVSGPESMVSDKDRLVIDQFLMNGGKILWMLDGLKIGMDSLKGANEGLALAVSNENGLYEMLFEYGVRLNRTLVVDFQGEPIQLDFGPKGNQRNLVWKSNYYAPLVLTQANAHPITSNLDPIRFEFAGSLDSVNSNPEVRKIPLLHSSELSKEMKAPVRISMDIYGFNQDYFSTGNKPKQMMAMILEGKFPSAFKDILGENLRNSPDFAFQEKSAETKMIVISDRDVVENKVDYRSGKGIPQYLGFVPELNRVAYGNKKFLLNCMNYLLDDQALITVRSRAIELRTLDKGKVAAYRSSIKILNTAVPIVLVLILGIVQLVIRKKRWAQQEAK